LSLEVKAIYPRHSNINQHKVIIHRLVACKGGLRIIEGIDCEAMTLKALLKDIRNVRFIIHYSNPFH